MKKHWMAISALALMAAGGAAPLALAAEEPTIRITSFQRAGNDVNVRIGEICGVVTGMTVPYQVKVIADPGRGEAHYMASADDAGRFCHLILAWYGRAEVQIWVPGTGAVATARVEK